MRLSQFFLLLTTLFILVTAVIATVFLLQHQKLIQAKAGSCHLYSFFITTSGAITVNNDQIIFVPAQSVSIIIDGSPLGPVKVPALEPGQSSTVDMVRVPPSGKFSWSVVGSDFCSSSGSHF